MFCVLWVIWSNTNVFGSCANKYHIFNLLWLFSFRIKMRYYFNYFTRKEKHTVHRLHRTVLVSIYFWAYTHARMYVHTYAQTRMYYIYTHARTHTYVHTRMYYIYTHVLHIHAWTRTRTHRHARARTRTHTCTHIKHINEFIDIDS